MTGFRVGDRVRAKRDARPRGTWRQFVGRVGTVRMLNADAGEIGVELDNEHGRLLTWFTPDELVVL